MAKRSTPKKRQARSQSSRRYKEFQKRAQKKLMGMVDFMKKLDKTGKLTDLEPKISSNVTKIKA
ncbi:hypothetical protein COY07_04470 [Candidatus Peregrinibacteria bacterium CG_4_10_14_0_2_um_filter_43_11]|nr:MAG: hypothetical protein COY07_04470 [Candidatus Peregrinibacteria bacterium CG_4_10_14_0_2_um_filter_43_11]